MLKRSILIPFFIVFSLIGFTACGYKPSSYYAKGAVKGKVFVDVIIDIDNSSNAVYIKDAINQMVLNRFKGSLTTVKKEADSYIIIDMKSISNSAIETDTTGYTRTYRTTVRAKVSYKSKNTPFKTINVSDYYDYIVDASSTVTTQKRNEAIRIASEKAISNIFSKIAVNNMK